MKSKWIIAGIIILLVFALAWSKSTDFSQDLGRHLKLGEIIVRTRNVPGTNLFSYTHPAFPFINHHWLSEVVYYLLTSAFGLAALYFLRFFLLAGAVLLAFKGKQRLSQYFVGAVSMLLFLPLLFERIGIRPEMFGYLFFSLLLYVIFFQKKVYLQYIIPVIMFLWVNLHISFVFGLFIVFIGGLQSWRRKQPVYGYLLGVAATFLNPNGIYGAVEPFMIFRNYGYMIVENQSVFFLNSVMFNLILRYYLYLAPLILFTVSILLIKKQYAGSVILAVFYALGMWQIRHISFFVFTAIFFVSQAFDYTVEDLKQIPYFRQYKRILPAVIIPTLAITIILVVSGIPSRIYDNPLLFGYGFYEKEKEATDFMLTHRLPERMFNNFDIGGYAVYRLYPHYKVFVDNRPEAYPADFFHKVYIPLQANDNLRQKIFRQHGIHTILFAHTDITPWGKAFVAHMLNDPAWKLVFINSSVFVMSDKTDLPDIRSNADFYHKLIGNANDPTALLHYAAFLSSLKQDDLVEKIMTKIKTINPFSCVVNRVDYAKQTSSDNLLKGAPISKSWWCY